MNLKSLRKKISKLETRLKEGPAKLEKWRRKLSEMEKAKARKATLKAAQTGEGEARRAAMTSAAGQQKETRPTPPAMVKAAGTRRSKPPAKAKRKLNLSPERRAQLAAAMKARWAAKRAGSQARPENG